MSLLNKKTALIIPSGIILAMFIFVGAIIEKKGIIREGETEFLPWLDADYFILISLALGLLSTIVALALIKKQAWSRLTKIVVALTYLAAIFAVPMYPHSSMCGKGMSYIDPLGLFAPSVKTCLDVSRPNILGLHYLATDLAILGWVILFIRFILTNIKKQGIKT